MNRKKQAGRKPDRVKIDRDWEDAVGGALKKKRPKEGWPKPGKDEDNKDGGTRRS